jgi:uncharacterized protein (DUF1501 family)
MTRTNISQTSLYDRRSWLKSSAASAMTSTTLLSTLVNLKLTSSALAAASIPSTGPYKAIVCVFFNGGIDGYQLLTPFGTTAGDSDYGAYATSRSNMAMKREGFDPVDSTYGNLRPIIDQATGKTFGIHPRLPYLRELYHAGRATFVTNVGTLVQPIASKSAFEDFNVSKPLGLFSHSDFQRHWHTAMPLSRVEAEGWGGRMADLLTDPVNQNSINVYTAISTAGNMAWQRGNRIRSYAISPQYSSDYIGGAERTYGFALPGTTSYSQLSRFDRSLADVRNDYANQTYSDLLEKSIATERHVSRVSAENFQAAIEAVTLPSGPGIVPFDINGYGLGGQLASVARVIKARTALNQNRQLFIVEVHGWDHHTGLLPGMNEQLPDVDRGIKAFHDFLQAEGLLDQVLTFSISDFARTISSNGAGTDHAWGNNLFVMGGAVNRGGGPVGTNRLWGTYPEIKLGSQSPWDTSDRGTYIPTLSSDVYLAEICRWLGVPNDDFLQTILPNIRNFHAAGNSNFPLGFLRAT